MKQYVYATPCRCFECAKEWLITSEADQEHTLQEMHWQEVENWKHCPYCGSAMIAYDLEE